MNSSNGTDATWEDNWLFKKRKLKTEHQSIAMLVPSPTEEIKALIGDKNADETSDMSDPEDGEEDKKSLPIRPITITSATPETDSLKSMQSLTSFDTTNPTLITEAKNNRILIDDSVFKQPAIPEQIQKINFVLSGAVTTCEPLTVKVDKATDEEKEFDSMVSPTQVREHKKSIDEQFEKLLMDDNNNSPMDTSASEIFLSPEPKKSART